jgi:hypothetical protein
MDVSKKTIENLFYRQIRDLTTRTNKMASFDMQFSDRWI